MGNRPASCDFALFGQLSQLVGFDPTSRKIAHKVSPRTVAWTNIMEDLSGLEVSDEDWIDEEFSESLINNPLSTPILALPSHNGNAFLKKKN